MNEALLKQMWENVAKFDEEISELIGFQAVAQLCAERETDNALSGAMWLVHDGMEKMLKGLEAQQMALAETYRQLKAAQQQVKPAPKAPTKKAKSK